MGLFSASILRRCTPASSLFDTITVQTFLCSFVFYGARSWDKKMPRVRRSAVEATNAATDTSGHKGKVLHRRLFRSGLLCVVLSAPGRSSSCTGLRLHAILELCAPSKGLSQWEAYQSQ